MFSEPNDRASTKADGDDDDGDYNHNDVVSFNY